jgi:hypothetical protein
MSKKTDKLLKLYGFKDNRTAAKAFNNIPESNLSNINKGTAGRTLQTFYAIIIALSEAIPSKKKRQKILANVNFLLDK